MNMFLYGIIIMHYTLRKFNYFFLNINDHTLEIQLLNLLPISHN